MTTRSKSIVSFLAVFLVAATAAVAAPNDVKQRIKERQGAIRALEAQGKIGETYDGRVEARGSLTPAEQKTVTEENADRQQLYQSIAAETSKSAAEVAELSGRKHFEAAGPNDWLKTKDGKWVQKKDLK
jgi:uncharacterized protein YdbL (DUF1318 family)